jgi:hypothetical protein
MDYPKTADYIFENPVSGWQEGGRGEGFMRWKNISYSFVNISS